MVRGTWVPQSRDVLQDRKKGWKWRCNITQNVLVDMYNLVIGYVLDLEGLPEVEVFGEAFVT